MEPDNKARLGLPTWQQLQLAISIYLKHSYGPNVPPNLSCFTPVEEHDPAGWLMSSVTERDPADAPLEQVRSFALRMGNCYYPHMKLRLSRPPNEGFFLFTVDTHDAFLHCPLDSPDYEALEQVKRHNAKIAATVTAELDAEGLPTERNYMRRKISDAKAKMPTATGVAAEEDSTTKGQ